MQEEIDNKVIALAINATKFTGRVLFKGIKGLVKAISAGHQKSQQNATGKVSMNNLRKTRGDLTSIELNDKLGRQFDKIARKYRVKYAIFRTEPGKYIVFFKAPEAEAMKQALVEFERVGSRSKEKSRGISLSKELERHRTHRERTRKREHQRDR